MKRLATILAAGLFLPACSAGNEPPAPNGGAAGTPSVPGAGNGPVGSGGNGPLGSGGTGPGTAGANTGAGHSVGYSLNCPTSKAGSPTLRLLTKTEFENTLNDVFPTIKGKWTNSLPASPGSESGFDNSASNVVGNQLAGALLDTAQSVAIALTGDGLSSLGLAACSTSSPDRACADAFLAKYGTRLFRRELTAEENTSYVAYFNKALAASDFKTALKWMTVGLIQSPHAVYRSELGTESGGVRKLSPYEIATQLSYTFTGSTPSEALLTKAKDNQLEGNLVELAAQMLKEDGGKRVLHRFFESYVDYPKAVSMVKAGYPSYPMLSGEMVKETRAFIDEVVVTKGGGMKELLTATTTNPSPTLAMHYGFPAPSAENASIQRPANQGIGIFAQGAFLASHSNTDASSPTQRGLFIIYRLLCRPPLKPPPGVPQISEAAKTNTTRERYEKAHASVGACAACHKQFDPIGFGFEHFDEAGKFRANEKGFPIDPSGIVNGPDGKELLSFKSQEELMTQLAAQPVVHQCLAAYMATYAFGTAEACLGSSQAEALQAGTMGITQAFAALAAEPHFKQRNSK